MKINFKTIKSAVLILLLCIISISVIMVKYSIINIAPVYAKDKTSNSTINSRLAIGEKPKQIELSEQILNNKSVVSIVQSKESKAEDIKYEEIKEMVKNAVEMAGGFKDIVKDGKTVVIKPNLVTDIDYTLPNWDGKPLSPEVNGTTTDYRVTRAIVELVRQFDPHGKVYIMEGSAFPTKRCMKQLNYSKEFIPGVDEFIAIEEDSGKWRDYNSPKLEKVLVKDPLISKYVYMNKRYKDADVVISVPVLKTHWTQVTTGSIKNVGIGATPANIYGGDKPGMLNRSGGIDHNKLKLDKWIHDWFMARPVDFTIVDGLQGIQNGPTPCYDMTRTTDIKQDQMNTRLILASKDCIAADTIQALVMEWDPAAVTYIGYLEKSGAGKSKVENIIVAGKQVNEVRKDFKGIAPKGKFKDLTPPKATILNTKVTGNSCSIKLSTDKKTAKIEVYIDGKLEDIIVPKDRNNVNIDVKANKKIVLRVYDKYLNCNEKQVVS